MYRLLPLTPSGREGREKLGLWFTSDLIGTVPRVRAGFAEGGRAQRVPTS